MTEFKQRHWLHLSTLGIEGLGDQGSDPTQPRGDPKRPMDESELRLLEDQYKVKFPSDYRSFLLEVGGCAFISSGIYTVINRKKQSMPLDVLYGAKSEKSYSLGKKLQLYTGRMPQWLIPIGDNGFGDQYCLELGSGRSGRIFFWDHSDEREESDYVTSLCPENSTIGFWSHSNIYLIAGSFNNLIESLRRLE